LAAGWGEPGGQPVTVSASGLAVHPEGAELWLTGISSIVLMFTCGGSLVAHSIAATMSARHDLSE
jgi:hypothetical protein